MTLLSGKILSHLNNWHTMHKIITAPILYAREPANHESGKNSIIPRRLFVSCIPIPTSLLLIENQKIRLYQP